MLSSAAEFISVQVVSNTIWNLAESGVQFTQQFVHHYLTPPDQSETFADMEGSKPSPSKRIYCISFNQDCSCLAIGHDDGYSFYSLRSLDKLEKIQDAKVPERACIVEKLFNSSLITVVSMKSTRKLQVYHSKKENEICSHTYASSIIAVRMNRKRVIVCLEDAIHIHNVRDMRLMHMIKETPPNPQGIMDLSNDDNNCFLAFPASPSTGHVHIFDAENLNTLCQITAHDGMLASIRFNPEGNKLATGSEKGTVIRVFAVPSGERLFEFTRGVSRCVQISSLAFSQDSRYLCLSSNTETVHIFSLVKQHEQQQDHLHHLQKIDEPNQEGISAWMSYLSQQASAYLPQQVNDLMLREKSVATARLPIIGQKTIVAMPRIQDVDYLLVASLDGYLFCYSLPTTTEMGECRLMRQYRIGPSGKPGSEVNDGGNEDDLEGMPVSFGTRTSQRSSRASESETHNKIQQTPIKSGSMRTGGSYGSSSSLCSPNSQTPKQVPPPIPPNPPKRMPSKSSTPVKDQSKANVTNPFDMEDFVTPLNEDTGVIIDTHEKDGSEQTGTENEQANILPPTDLNDLDEFPPLHHATT